MPTITIEWKKFDRKLPEIISEEYYENIKYNKAEFPKVTFNYIKVFKKELLFILAGILSGIGLATSWGNGLVLGGLFLLFLLSGFYQLISLIISSTSFISDYFIVKDEIKKIETAISNSNSYHEFCSLMAKTNKSYVMYLARLNQ